jgi:hypothetical protein
MEFFRSSLIVLCATSAWGSPGAQARPAERRLEFDISGVTVRFSVPPHPSDEVPRLAPVRHLDLRGLAAGTESSSEQLFRELWEIRSGPLFGRELGLFTVRFAVLSRPGAPGDMRCPDELWRHQKEAAVQWAAEHTKALSPDERHSSTDQLRRCLAGWRAMDQLREGE